MKKLCWAAGVVILFLGLVSIAQWRKIDGLNSELRMARYKIEEQKVGISSMREAIYTLQARNGSSWQPVDTTAQQLLFEQQQQTSTLRSIEDELRWQSINTPALPIYR